MAENSHITANLTSILTLNLRLTRELFYLLSFHFFSRKQDRLFHQAVGERTQQGSDTYMDLPAGGLVASKVTATVMNIATIAICAIGAVIDLSHLC